MGWTVVVLVGAAGLAVLGWLRHRLVVVDVDGSSMEPAFHQGDRVLLRRTALRRIRRGDVVVVERPDRPGVWPPSAARRRIAGRAWMIKRAAAVEGDPVPPDVIAAVGPSQTSVPAGCLVVFGDNPAGSYDSRSCGYFPADRVLGVVIRRLPG